MKVVVPVEVTPARLLASSLPARHCSEPALYSAVHTYAMDDTCTVVDATVNAIYQSLSDDNIGNYPPDNLDKWISLGGTNRFSPFDPFIHTKARDLDGVGYVWYDLDVSRTNCIGAFGLQGTSVDLSLYTSAGSLRAATSVDLAYEGSAKWSQYFFEVAEYRDRVFWRYPFIPTGRLRFRVNAAGGGGQIGSIMYGMDRYIGKTLWPVGGGMQDYSDKTTDARGRTYVKKGLNADRINFTIDIDPEKASRIRRRMADAAGRICLWMVDNALDVNNTLDGSQEYMFLPGFYSGFDSKNDFTHEYTLEIEGVV